MLSNPSSLKVEASCNCWLFVSLITAQDVASLPPQLSVLTSNSQKYASGSSGRVYGSLKLALAWSPCTSGESAGCRNERPTSLLASLKQHDQACEHGNKFAEGYVVGLSAVVLVMGMGCL
jgi:hypothetical protein